MYPGPWGYILRHLGDQVHLITPPASIQREAHTIVDAWASSEHGIKLLQSSTDPEKHPVLPDPDGRSFVTYRENMIIHSWPALVGPHNIFEKRCIIIIARVMELPQREIRQAYAASKDISNLRRFADGMSFDDELLAIMWRAYHIDLLVRGRYHDETALLQSGQVMHHPCREPILRRLSGSRTGYRVTNSDRAFASVLLAGALAERTPQKRMDLWLENVLAARKAAQCGEFHLAGHENDEAARRAAAQQARKLGLRTHAELYDDITDAAIAAGTGLLTSFILSGWVDVAIAVAMYASAKAQNLGSTAGKLTFERRRRLETLASSDAGRVEREWSSTNPADLRHN